MEIRLNIRKANQQSETSCWATCGRLINNYYAETNHQRYLFNNDQEFGEAVNLDINQYQDIQTALDVIKCYDGQDDKANIPTLEEIRDSIESRQQPLAVCVSATPVEFPDHVTQGHYILITGVDVANGLIYVMDPDPRVEHVLPIAYNNSEYIIGHQIPTQYWGVTYYTDDTAIHP